MPKKIAPMCVEHNVKKEWRAATFEYYEDGIVVCVPNVLAWVCPQDGEASFTPETTDELIITVRELIETARHAKARKSSFKEYVVAVGR